MVHASSMLYWELCSESVVIDSSARLVGTCGLRGVTWTSLKAQESRLRPRGLQGNSVVLGNYTTEQPETNCTRLLSKELSKTLSKADRNDAE